MSAKLQSQSEPIDTLVEQINEEHRAVQEMACGFLERLKRQGQLLSKAKSELAHGEFTGWVEKRLNFGMRHAQRCMQIAKHWPELEAKSETMSHLSVADALAFIQSPKPPRLPPAKSNPEATQVENHTPGQDQPHLDSSAEVAAEIEGPEKPVDLPHSQSESDTRTGYTDADALGNALIGLIQTDDLAPVARAFAMVVQYLHVTSGPKSVRELLEKTKILHLLQQHLEQAT